MLQNREFKNHNNASLASKSGLTQKVIRSCSISTTMLNNCSIVHMRSTLLALTNYHSPVIVISSVLHLSLFKCKDKDETSLYSRLRLAWVKREKSAIQFGWDFEDRVNRNDNCMACMTTMHGYSPLQNSRRESEKDGWND